MQLIIRDLIYRSPLIRLLVFVLITKEVNKVQTNVLLDIKNLILLLQKNKGYVCKHIPCAILKC